MTSEVQQAEIEIEDNTTSNATSVSQSPAASASLRISTTTTADIESGGNKDNKVIGPCFPLLLRLSDRSQKSKIVLGLCLIFPLLIALLSATLYFYPDGITLYSTEMEMDLKGLDQDFDGSNQIPIKLEIDSSFFSIEGEELDDKISVENENEKIPRSYVFQVHNTNDYADRIRHHSQLQSSTAHHIFTQNTHNYTNKNNNDNIGIRNFMERSITSKIIHNRLVHFDLKGAPPKLSFLKEVLKLASESGINGLLVEWEDTFPWKDSLRNLTLTTGGYTLSEVQELISYAENELDFFEVIPLIQTFGHVEFILKQEEFAHLRELDDDPQSFCPSKNEALTLIEEMIDQIIQVHKKASFIHIGCDEVFNLRMCSLCQSSSESRDSLFLDHVVKVAKLVRDRSKLALVWDDMLRNIPEKLLIDSNIGNLVEPMVWVYAENIDRFVNYDTWDKYSRIFPTIWGAGAFKGKNSIIIQVLLYFLPFLYKKGAFGETLQIPIVNRHAHNTETWVEVIARESLRWSNGVGGLVLTGWQRYDHFATLAELLPSSVPSLVYNSLVLSIALGSPEIKNRILIPVTTHLPQIPYDPSIFNNVNNQNYTIKINEPLSTNDNQTTVEEILQNQNNLTSTILFNNFKRDIRRRRRKRFAFPSSETEIGSPVPHPRSLMKKTKDKDKIMGKFTGPISGPGFSLTNPRRLMERDLLSEILIKNRKITSKFIEILQCPRNAQNVPPYDIPSHMKESDPELSYCAKCNFPGVAFFRTLFRLRSLLNEVWELQAKIDRKRGWVRQYNIRHNYTAPKRVDEVLFPTVTRLRRNLVITAKSIGNSLNPFFSPEVILEWIEQNIWEAFNILDRYEKVGASLKLIHTWPRRPLKTPKEMIIDLGLYTLDPSRDEL